MKKKSTIPNYILAPKTTRALNFAIDIIFINIFRAIFYFTAAFIVVDEDSTLLERFNSFDDSQNFLLWTIIMFFYYATFEIIFAKSLSKYFTKTVVVMMDGSKPKPINILGRTLIRIFPFEYFSFLRGRKLGWHDEYSGTFVVKKEKLENSKKEFFVLENF